MALSIVQICNAALASIGGRRIVALTDPTREGRSCNDLYDSSRRSVLRMHKWNCAVKREILTTVDSPAPAFGFTYAFTLPNDFIRVHTVFEGDIAISDEEYRVEGLSIATDRTSVYLKYIYDCADVTKFDPLLDEAIAQYLGWKLSPQLSASEEQKLQCERGFKAALQRARFVDSTEDPSERIDADEWIASRTGNSGFVRDPMT